MISLGSGMVSRPGENVSYSLTGSLGYDACCLDISLRVGILYYDASGT